jgi:hypothetical protein
MKMFDLYKIKVVVLLAPFVMSACSSLPEYKIPSGRDTATIKTLNSGVDINMCLQGKVYSLKKNEKNQSIVIPAGERITISSYSYFIQGNYSYRCNPSLSFFPEAGISYITDTNVVARQCRIELAKESESAPYYMEFEKSIDKRDCFEEKAEEDKGEIDSKSKIGNKPKADDEESYKDSNHNVPR